MKYSVVIPCYNSAAFIDRCLTSVLFQTLAPSEVLIVDDCSSDNTAIIIDRYIPKFKVLGVNLRYKKLSKNSGPSTARNVAINMANGDYIAFLDSDDSWQPCKLEIADRFLNENKCELLFHDYLVNIDFSANINYSNFNLVKYSLIRLIARNPAQTSCVLMRNKKNYLFDVSMKYCEDYNLWLQIADLHSVYKLTGPSLTSLNRPQLTSGGLSANIIRMRLGEIISYLNFCKRLIFPRIFIFPLLISYSILKFCYSNLILFINRR